jgi:hypothetical protein
MSSEALHVARERLSDDARLMHYAIASLMEELEAVDWYRQRADDAEDPELRGVLLHNMREEMEHASMLIEWLRRRNADFAGHLKTYLFTDAPLLEVEHAAENGGGGNGAAPKPRGDGLTVGTLRPS